MLGLGVILQTWLSARPAADAFSYSRTSLHRSQVATGPNAAVTRGTTVNPISESQLIPRECSGSTKATIQAKFTNTDTSPMNAPNNPVIAVCTPGR